MARRRNARWEEMDKRSVDLGVLKQHFEVHNKTEGKSPDTVTWYNEVLTLFLRWLDEKGMSTALPDVGEVEVRAFILYVQEKPGIKGPMSSHTVANRVRALRSFFAWLHRKGYTNEHLLKDLKTPKTAEKIIDTLTKEEVDRIFGAMNPKTALGARNTAMVSLMLDTGLRVSEVATLKEQDVHLEDRYLKVMGKGSKERMVAFGAACQRSLVHYYHHFELETAHEGVDTFFLSIDGYPLKTAAIQALVDRLARSSGITRLHPHLMRHTYATWFLMNGGDIFLLKNNLGHSSMSVVLRYLHIASRSVAVLSQRFSPLDRLEVKDGRRFSHKFKGAGAETRVYPHAGARLAGSRSKGQRRQGGR